MNDPKGSYRIAGALLAFRIHLFGWISRFALRSRWCTRAELSRERLIQRHPRRLLDAQYDVYRFGHPQEDDQLLREGCEWHGAVGRQASGDPPGARGVEEDVAHALDSCDGGNDVHGLDL